MHRTFAHMIIIYLISLIRYIFYSNRHVYHICYPNIRYWYYTNILHTYLDTVDGCEILHQFIGGKHPIIHNFSIITGAGLRKTLHSSSHIDIQ